MADDTPSSNTLANRGHPPNPLNRDTNRPWPMTDISRVQRLDRRLLAKFKVDTKPQAGESPLRLRQEAA
jgi:hypothetical protein